MSAVPASRTTKSPEAFRTISEVAAELDVPQHVLRFWETRFPQVHPVKRAGGRRYYRPEEVDLLRGIRSLLYSDGYTIKGAQKILRENGVRQVIEQGKRQPRGRRAAVSESPDEPRHARAAIARVQSAHPETSPVPERPNALDGARSARLEALLGELLQMQEQFRSVCRRFAA